MSLYRYRWPLIMAVGMVGAAGGGALVGGQAAADMNPFYANLAATSSGTTSGPEIVDTPIGDPAPVAVTTDLRYAPAVATADTGEMARQ